VRGIALAALSAVLAAAPAGATPPREGVLVPGERLGGIGLGMTGAQVRTAWGNRFGVCRTCARTTWYFNRRPFEPQGAGVELRGNRVAAVFTLWAPPGWRTTRGLRIGESAARVTTLYGALPQVHCGVYSARTLRRGRTVTAFYVLDEDVWGFGLLRPGVSVCR
jgi:hypothetical protein